jgi:hypothetical protein
MMGYVWAGLLLWALMSGCGGERSEVGSLELEGTWGYRSVDTSMVPENVNEGRIKVVEGFEGRIVVLVEESEASDLAEGSYEMFVQADTAYLAVPSATVEMVYRHVLVRRGGEQGAWVCVEGSRIEAIADGATTPLECELERTGR